MTGGELIGELEGLDWLSCVMKRETLESGTLSPEPSDSASPGHLE